MFNISKLMRNSENESIHCLTKPYDILLIQRSLIKLSLIEKTSSCKLLFYSEPSVTEITSVPINSFETSQQQQQQQNSTTTMTSTVGISSSTAVHTSSKSKHLRLIESFNQLPFFLRLYQIKIQTQSIGH